MTATLLHLPGQNIQEWHCNLITLSTYCNHVSTYLTRRAEVYDLVRETMKRQREDKAARYNREIFQTVHYLGDMVMLFQKNTTKLEPCWRDPFWIARYRGSHRTSFELEQLNKRKIRETFHKD